MKLRTAGLAACCLLALTGEVRAQAAWDSPILLSPRPVAGTGVYLIDAHGAGLGVLGTWRGPGQRTGLRVGVTEGRGGDGIGILGGVDMMAPLATVSPDFPLDISWYTGVGAGYADWLVVSIPLGITMGRTFGDPQVRFTPYLAPRIVADVHLGRDPPAERNELDLNVGVDLGFDVMFQPGWTLRLGAGLGDRDGLAIGIIF